MPQSITDLTPRLCLADHYSYAKVGQQSYVVIYPLGCSEPEVVPIKTSAPGENCAASRGCLETSAKGRRPWPDPPQSPF
ncbi:MAG: hypothetical protein ACO4CG_11530 [Prochlorothrix sp.]|nr:hypothetical protein [Prochlorothrix sp.]